MAKGYALDAESIDTLNKMVRQQVAAYANPVGHRASWHTPREGGLELRLAYLNEDRDQPGYASATILKCDPGHTFDDGTDLNDCGKTLDIDGLEIADCATVLVTEPWVLAGLCVVAKLAKYKCGRDCGEQAGGKDVTNSQTLWVWVTGARQQTLVTVIDEIICCNGDLWVSEETDYCFIGGEIEKRLEPCPPPP